MEMHGRRGFRTTFRRDDLAEKPLEDVNWADCRRYFAGKLPRGRIWVGKTGQVLMKRELWDTDIDERART